MPPPLASVPCSTHPTARAGWECLHCSRALCPDCAALGETRSAVRTEITFTCCVHCDGPVRQLMVQGTRRDAYRAGLVHVLNGPAGLFTVVGGVLLVIGVTLAHGLGPVGRWVMAGLIGYALSCMVFAVIKAVATDAGEGSSLAMVDDVLRPALSGLVPLGGSFLLVAGLEPVLGGLLAGAVLWGLAALAPAWLLALASGRPLPEALSPGRMVELIRTLGRDYALTAVLSIGIAQLSAFWLSASLFIAREGMLFFRVVLEVCSAGGLLFLARVLGQLLKSRGAELGLADAPVTLVPALPDAAPRGVRRR